MFCTCFVKTRTFILLRCFNSLFLTVDMNCELIYFVRSAIHYASLHWCSSLLCTNFLYCLLDNSQNISFSHLAISYFCCCKLIYHFRRTAFDKLWDQYQSLPYLNFGLYQTPCSIYSGSDWMINLNPSNQHIFHTFITCSAHSWLWLCCRFPRIVANSIWNSYSSSIIEMQTPC